MSTILNLCGTWIFFVRQELCHNCVINIVFLGHRFKTTYDFGFVALDILYAYAEDSGTYMCKAKNAVGEAVTTCSVKVEGKLCCAAGG